MATTREIGFLVATTPGDWVHYIKSFNDKLNTFNDVDAAVTLLPPGGAKGDSAKITSTAGYLAGNFEVIVTAGTYAALACKAAIQSQVQTYPDKPPPQLVFAAAGDPGMSGLTPQPGGNYTGCSNQQIRLVSLRVDEMLKPENGFQEPFAVVGNYNIEPIKTAMGTALGLLIARGKQAQIASITPQDDLDGFISGLKRQGIKSLYVCSDMFITINSAQLNAKAHAGPPASQMKVMHEIGEHVRDRGGDLSCGVMFSDLFETAADRVRRILNGEKAGNIALYEPPTTKREVVKKQSRPAQAKGSASATKERSAPAMKKKARRR
jgi:hypothetical protein